MPIYIYQHPKTQEYIEIVQGMHEAHEYVDEKGIAWKRVFSPPNMAIDLEVDPFSNTQFIEKTKNAGTMGELWDRSTELSQKRAAQSGGKDPYRQKYFKEYAKKRAGQQHLDDH